MNKISPATTYSAVIGRVIANLRKRRGMDQGEASKKSGISRSSWSRLENGDAIPDALQLTKIAEALGTSSAEIIREADEAREYLKRQGIKVEMNTKPKSFRGGVFALIGVAALGAIMMAKANADEDKEDE